MQLQELARLRRPVYGISKLWSGHSRLSSPLVLVTSKMYTWNTDGAMGNYILLVILVILLMRQFPLNPYLNSNLPDANIGPQMLCPPSPPLLARLLLTSW